MSHSFHLGYGDSPDFMGDTSVCSRATETETDTERERHTERDGAEDQKAQTNTEQKKGRKKIRAF